MICTVLYLKKRVNVLCDPLSGMNRGFCLCPNNSEPQPVWDSCERTSLKVVFEAVIRMEDGCVFYPSVCVWFGLRLLIWSWHYEVKLVFFFSPPLPRKLLPPSGTGLWKAGQVSPTRMAWKYTRIYPAVLSLSLMSAADYKHRERRWVESSGVQRNSVGQCRNLSG